MKFGIRIPSIKKRISARISPARFVRHRLGVKLPKGAGFIADPKKFIYNKIYNKTSVGAEKLIPGEGKSGKLNFFLIIASAIKSFFNKKIEIVVYENKFKDHVFELINNIQENEFGNHSTSGRPDLKDIPGVYQKDNGNFWVALENGKVIGTIGLRDFHNQMGEMWRFYVKKELRRAGIGKKLLDTLLKFAKEKSYKTIFLATQLSHLSANNFYAKHGFKRIEAYPSEIPAPTKDDTFYKFDL